MTCTSKLFREPAVILVEEPVIIGANETKTSLDLLSESVFERRLVVCLDDGNTLLELQVVSILRSLDVELTEPPVGGGDGASGRGVVCECVCVCARSPGGCV